METFQEIKREIESKGCLVKETPYKIIIVRAEKKIIYYKEINECDVFGFDSRLQLETNPIYEKWLELIRVYRRERCLDVC